MIANRKGPGIQRSARSAIASPRRWTGVRSAVSSSGGGVDVVTSSLPSQPLNEHLSNLNGMPLALHRDPAALEPLTVPLRTWVEAAHDPTPDDRPCIGEH